MSAVRAASCKPPGADAPEYAPTRSLDIELELGFVVGVPTTGEPVPPERFADHVFGVLLVNDWSARDIQAWEYVPLGPFLAKSFQTSIRVGDAALAARGSPRRGACTGAPALPIWRAVMTGGSTSTSRWS